VEHDGEEIWSTVVEAIAGALAGSNRSGSEVRAIGITNQRETTLLWDRAPAAPCTAPSSGKTVAPPPSATKLRAKGVEPLVYERAGLLLDPYFSGTKIALAARPRRRRPGPCGCAASWRSAPSTPGWSTS
jgi:glycerol kinase